MPPAAPAPRAAPAAPPPPRAPRGLVVSSVGGVVVRRRRRSPPPARAPRQDGPHLRRGVRRPPCTRDLPPAGSRHEAVARRGVRLPRRTRLMDVKDTLRLLKSWARIYV